MSSYELVLFDPDGTLTDPCEGITNSVAYALEKFGIHTEDKRELAKFIGPPLLESFNKFYGFDEEQSWQALTYYREYFTEKGIMENFVYDGIEELLQALLDGGKVLCVATSKPEPFAKTILDSFKLSRYFKYIAGADLAETRAKKDEVIEYALRQCEVTDRSKVIMVGDREHDIFGAAKCSLHSIGVLFGYGNREELESAGATYIAETVDDIAKIIL